MRWWAEWTAVAFCVAGVALLAHRLVAGTPLIVEGEAGVVTVLAVAIVVLLRLVREDD